MGYNKINPTQILITKQKRMPLINNKTLILIIPAVVIILAGFGFPNGVLAIKYYPSGNFVSTNLLLGVSPAPTSIDSFVYNLSAKPSPTTATVGFNQNGGSTWYKADGITVGTETLVTGSNQTIALTGGWSGANFYYRVDFTSSDWVGTPVLDDIALNYNRVPTASTISESSTIGSPTNVGSNVTFSGTISDPDASDQVRLAICKTDAINASSQCTGGAWCYAPSSSGWQAEGAASYDYTALDGDAYSNAWYAYACDDNNACINMTESDGTFYVNHAPEFPAVSNNGPKDPGGTLTVSTTTGCKDDTRDTSGQVKLYVCKEQNCSSSGCGGTGQWCDSLTSGSSGWVDNNPNCTFTVPNPDGTYDYYTYVYDTWGMASDGVKQALLGTFDVNNIAPVVSSVSLNGAANITITANSSSNISATATISDSNGCTVKGGGNEIASANAVFFQDNLTTEACSTDENKCYIVASCSLGSCSSGSLTATCQATMWFNANPTDAGAYASHVSRQWNDDKWTAWVKGIDDDAANHSTTNYLETIEVATVTGLNITEGSIDYPNLNPGESTVIANNDSVTTNSVGNCPIDNNIHGSTVLTKGGDTIPNSNQKYGLTNADWASLSATLQNTATLFELAQTTKTTAHASPIQETIYFGLKIPDIQTSGTYAGVNTFSPVEENTF